MARCDSTHTDPINGVAKCSRPMWCGGMPAGFCDAPAYGPQEPDQRRSGDYYNGKWTESYVPYWACYAHGGPKEPQPSAASSPQQEPK